VIRCPWHDDAVPSCSVRTTDAGAVYARCFACGAKGDVFALIAQVRGLNVKTQFSAVLRAAERLADEMSAAAPDDYLPMANYWPPALPDDTFEKLVTTLFGVCTIEAAPDVRDYLEKRGLLDQARNDGWGALPEAVPAQADIIGYLCAVHGEETWVRSGLSPRFPTATAFSFATHRLLIPWRGPDGSVLGLQRRLLPPADQGRSDKYVFSRGRSPRALYGVEKLAGSDAATELALVEGAVDVLAMRVLCERRGARRVVLGVPGVSNWKAEWASLAAGRVAHVAFDNDAAGDKASGNVGADLHRAGATRVLRTRPSAAKDWAEIVERGLR
jgi:DNA primase